MMVSEMWLFCTIQIILNATLHTIHIWIVMHASSQTERLEPSNVVELVFMLSKQDVLYGPNLDDSDCAFVRKDSKSL